METTASVVEAKVPEETVVVPTKEAEVAVTTAEEALISLSMAVPGRVSTISEERVAFTTVVLLEFRSHKKKKRADGSEN